MYRSDDRGRGPEKGRGRSRGEGSQGEVSRKKLKARVNEVQQGLQDALRKCETLERDVSPRETELAKARQSAEMARNEAQGALQVI